MTIRITDISFRSNLRLYDILIAKDGNHYIVTKGESAEFPYKISNLITHETKRNLQTLEKQVTRIGHILGVGYLHKIIGMDHYEIELKIVAKETSR
ncbi:hypothetical protein SAMN04487777_13210 [Priestia aryabhattai B8W22]|uniref:hypothetical protein n=1 Tax=Priestia aryabhattai TaxID=412384 RepID=UPI0008882322|nr:hypothetical protein SAMN04487777_13210 [Priestia aryabhattai B8W22]